MALVIKKPIGQIGILLNLGNQAPRPNGVYHSGRNKISLFCLYGYLPHGFLKRSLRDTAGKVLPTYPIRQAVNNGGTLFGVYDVPYLYLTAVLLHKGRVVIVGMYLDRKTVTGINQLTSKGNRLPSR